MDQMSTEQIERKLSIIASLTAEEIEGWRMWAWMFRERFPGEVAALAERERQISGVHDA